MSTVRRVHTTVAVCDHVSYYSETKSKLICSLRTDFHGCVLWCPEEYFDQKLRKQLKDRRNYTLFLSPYIVRMSKLRRVRWAWYVARMR
jgi:hypothetical protein